MSQYCWEHRTSLFSAPYPFRARYTAFPNAFLNAWERQALFQDIVGHYQETLKRHLQRNKIFVQDGYVAPKKQRRGRTEKPVPRIQRRTTRLSRLVKYLSYLPAERVSSGVPFTKNPDILAEIAFYQAKSVLWARIVSLAAAIRERTIARMQPVLYQTGSHRRSVKESRSRVTLDESNGLYTLWYAFRIGTGKQAYWIYLPLLSNRKRAPLESLRLDAIHTVTLQQGRKLQIGATYAAQAPVFQEEGAWEGIDVNTKTNLMATSRGRLVDYDAARVSALLALAEKLSRKENPSYRDAARMRRLAAANASSIQRILSELLDTLESEGVTDIAVEDIEANGYATFVRHPVFRAKYSRLAKLLRLANLKNWLASQAEKRGIRVHVTNPAYTSQECPVCGHIDAENRESQEVFRCVRCGHEAHADLNAAENIERRVRADVPRGSKARLHQLDRYGRASPQPLELDTVRRNLLQGDYYEGCVPAASPEPLAAGLPNKVDSPRVPDEPVKEAASIEGKTSWRQ